MIERKLTPEQIDELFSFCEEQDVHHYDLQLELVDHLAAAIEQKWKEKPKLSYDKALWTVFDQFGVSGFRKIRKAKEKELRRKYSRLLWKYMGEFFKLPKIILTIAITLILFGIFRKSENNMDTFLLLLFPYLIFLAVIQFMNKKKYQISLVPGKSFLLNDHLKWIKSRFDVSFQVPTFAMIFYVEYLQRTNEYQAHNVYIELLIAFLVTFFCIFIVVMSIYIPKRIKEDFIREFPQFIKS